MLRDLGAELVLSAGDLPWDYVEWVGDAVGVPVVFVPGNHDPRPAHAATRAFAGRTAHPAPEG